MAKNDLIGTHLSKIAAPDSNLQIAHSIKSTFAEGSNLFETSYLTRTGLVIDVEISEKLIQFRDKSAILSVSRNITKRKNAEEALREMSTRIQTLFEAIPDIVYFKDINGRNLLVNRAYEQFVGMSQDEIAGKTDEELLPAKLAKISLKNDKEVLEKLTFLHFKEEFTDKHGNTMLFDTVKVPILDVQGNPVGLVGVRRDITEHERLREQLQIRQRMDSLGTLAGGIAHDFNNLLQES